MRVRDATADDSTEVAGWLALDDFKKRPACHPAIEVAVYVAESHRGWGAGKLLVKEAIRRGPESGVRALIAGIFAHNAASLSLFESLGFERRAGRRRVRPDLPRTPALLTCLSWTSL